MRLWRRRARDRDLAAGHDLDLRALWDDGEDADPSDEVEAAGADAADVADADADAADADADADTAGVDAAGADAYGDGDADADVGGVDGAGADGPVPVAAASPPRRPPRGGRRQALGVCVLAAAVAAGIIADRAIGSDATPVAAAPPPALPTLAPAGALSSTWYCPALGASVTSAARGRVIIANPSATAVTATVTLVPSSGAPVVDHPRIAPFTRTTVRLEDVAPGAYAAATVTFDGAGGAVEQEVDGPLGQSIAPCASASADHWYFATGATTANATEYLSLYNPYPAPAIADVRFETDQGPSTPDAFQGVVVPGGGFNVIDVGARVRSRAQVSAVVDVRSGRLVVDKLQVLGGPARSGPRGLVLTLGAPALGNTWYYADGASGPGVTERFDVYNPAAVEADVSLAPVLEQGSADPFDLTVPAESMVSLQVDQQSRIPPGVGQAWVLTSTNGIAVVAERVITSGPPGVEAGVSDATGAPAPAARWVFPAGSAADGADEWLSVLDPGGAPAHLTVVASGAGTAVRLPDVVVGAGTRRSIDIGRVYPAGVVVLDVTADVPIVAERAQFVINGPGMSNATGIAGG